MGNVLAAADDGLGGGQLSEFLAKSKRPVQQAGKVPIFLAPPKQHFRFRRTACCDQSCDLALDQRELNSSDSGRFSGREDAMNAGLLRFVHPDAAVLKFATQQ